jgi:adenylate kinase
VDFTLELVRQLAGHDHEVRERWREKWKRVKLCQRQSVVRRKQSKPQHDTGHSTQRDLPDSGNEALTTARLEAERIVQAAQAEAESIIESARIRADEMTAAATQMLLDATERGTIPVTERLRLREHSRIVLVGPPGSGKGTQAPFLSKLLEVPLIHVGELYRSNIAGRTAVGKKLYDYMNRGKLVPDEVTLEMLADRLHAPDTQHGFILDGLPRNLSQAVGVDDLLASTSEGIEAALNFDISRDESFKRVIGRRVCKNDSSHRAHVTYATPQKYGRCDVCGGPLYTREDDSRHVIAKRWEVWKYQTEPVVQKYGAEGRLVTVSGIGTVSGVTERALTALYAYFG